MLIDGRVVFEQSPPPLPLLGPCSWLGLTVSLELLKGLAFLPTSRARQLNPDLLAGIPDKASRYGLLVVFWQIFGMGFCEDPDGRVASLPLNVTPRRLCCRYITFSEYL